MGAMIRISQFKTKFPATFEKYFGFGWPGWIQALIWMATFVVLTGLMARELSANLDDYNWNNIVPEMNVVVSEVNPANLTVCAPYYSTVLDTVSRWVILERRRKLFGLGSRSIPDYNSCHECEGMINNAWDVWRDEEMFAQENDPPVQLAIALVKKVVESIEIANDTLLNKSNAHWDQAIVDALWLVVSCRANGDNEFFKGDLYVRFSFPICYGNNLSSLDYIPDETFNQLNDLLLDSMNIYVRLLVDINLISDLHGPLKQIEGLTLLGSVMCFRVPQHAHATGVIYHANVTYPGTSELYLPWARGISKPEVQGRFVVYDDTMLYNLGDTSVTLFKSEAETISEFGWNYVQLTYNLQTYMDVRGQDITCSKDNNPMSCKAKLQFAYAVKHCGCVPFLHRSLRGNDSSLPYCNASSYEACKYLLETDLLDYSYCTRICEYADYKFWTAVNHMDLNKLDSEKSPRGVIGLYLSLTAMNGSTLKIDFTSKTTLAQFMSQIGGTLNLYLGLSGFTICAFSFFLIDRAKRRGQRRNNSVNSGQHSPILGLHSLWFVRALQTVAKQDAGGISGKPDDDTIMKMMKNFEILADRLDSLEGKQGKLDEDKIMKNFEVMEKRLDDLGGKTNEDKIINKFEVMEKRLDELAGKPNEDKIMKILETMEKRLDDLAGKANEDKIMKKFEVIEKRLDELVGKCGKPEEDTMTILV